MGSWSKGMTELSYMWMIDTYTYLLTHTQTHTHTSAHTHIDSVIYK